MANTPGFVLPSSFSSQQDLEDDIHRRDAEAGFTTLNLENFGHSSTDDLVDEFFEHYGVRGMHWGIRRDEKTGVRPLAKTLNDSRLGKAANRHARNSMGSPSAKAGRKIGKTIRDHPVATGVGVGAAAVGAVGVGIFLKKAGHVKVKDIYEDAGAAKKVFSGKELINMRAQDRIASLNMAIKSGKINENQYGRLMKLVMRDYRNQLDAVWT